MRRLSVLLLTVALSVSTAGCTIGAHPGALRPATPRALSAARLASALLTVADLPGGYAFDAGAGDTGPSDAPSSSGNLACDEVFDQVLGSGPFGPTPTTATAGVEFTRGDHGPFISQSLRSSRNRAGPHAAFDTMRRIPQLCGEFTESDDDGSFTFRLTEAPFPRLSEHSGDDSLAVRLDARGGGEGITITFGGYLVLIRVATTLSMIVHVGTPGVDATETEKVARAAVARLVPVVRAR